MLTMFNSVIYIPIYDIFEVEWSNKCVFSYTYNMVEGFRGHDGFYRAYIHKFPLLNFVSYLSIE